MAWVVRGEFRKLWIGQLVSASGSAITTVALPLVVAAATTGMLFGVLIALLSPLRTFQALPSDQPSRRSMVRD